MRLSRLSIQGFRNLKKTDLVLDPSVSVYGFVGDNGQGKTNLLESIFLCALSKSFRTRENEDLIGFEEDYFSVKAKIEGQAGTSELEVVAQKTPPQKALKVQGVKKKAIDFIGQLKVVFFSPDDLGIIHLSPSLRRRYLDVLLSQLDREYLDASYKYHHVLIQRNTLLKQIADRKADKSELDFWDQELLKFGSIIHQKRARMTEDLSSTLQPLYQGISGNKGALQLLYKPGFGNLDQAALRLLEHRESDLRAGATQLGPHRDDLAFILDGHDLASFGSRGEWRSAILVLKFAEMELIRRETGEYPVLLLDDVFSELDEARQKYLFNLMEGVQIFVTTTHSHFLDIIQAPKILFSVKNGMARIDKD